MRAEIFSYVVRVINCFAVFGCLNLYIRTGEITVDDR